MRQLTLGSLFSGAGGFELAGTYAGITPVWASEIEPFPILVTSKLFPCMKHLGNITEIDGADIDPVDIITFGSPCQDLSTANSDRKGLGGKRSGLFGEAVRIITEMREATDGRYPTFIVWENVPGAFSSNKGKDFREVLEKITRIKDHEATIPEPFKNKWSTAGEIMGDDYSLAWRVYDAQYWGVPQRRRRIFLVADFGGKRAGRIQFERESMFRDIAQGEITGERHTQVIGDCAETASGITAGFNGHKSITGNICYNDERSPCIETKMPPNVLAIENHPNDGRAKISGNVVQTLSSRMGTGGNNTPMVLCAPQAVAYDCRNYKDNEKVNPTLQAKSGGGYSLNYINPVFTIGNGQADQLKLHDKAGALNFMHDQQNVLIHSNITYRIRRLTPLECCRLQGFPDYWTQGLEYVSPSEKDIDKWCEIFETHRKVTAPGKKPKTRNQIRKWLENPISNSAEYKMWGNSLAIPCAYTILAGIAEELQKLEKR